MEHIGILTSDPHLMAELKAWLKDLPGEFEVIELAPHATVDPPTLKDGEESEEVNATPKLKLVIFDSRLPTHLKKWREDLKLENIPWLAIGREEHAKNPHDESIDGCTDLILLPLDRLVLLQKAEFLLAGAASITPSFLFLSKTDLSIELAKPVQITHLSEIGCTISALKPVAPGVEGSLISRIFSTDGAVAESVEVRVVSSSPFFDSSIASASHADPKLAFEVNLRFFGLKQKQLLAIRKLLLRSYPHGFPEIQRSDKAPSNTLHVAMISPDTVMSSRLQSSLEQLTVVSATSFGGLSSFRSFLMKKDLKKRRSNSLGTSKAPDSAIQWSDTFIGPQPESFHPLMPSQTVTNHLRLSDGVAPHTIEKMEPPLKRSDRWLDTPIDTWLKDASYLFKGLSEIDRETLLEGIIWTSTQSTSAQAHATKETSFTFDYNIDEFFALKLTFKIQLLEEKTPAKPALISIKVETTTGGQDDETSGADTTLFDAIMVDASLLQLDTKSKMAFLKSAIESHSLKNSFGHVPPVIVFNANEAGFQSQELRGTMARQLLYNFNDRRYQAEIFISMSRPELWTSPLLEISGLKTELRAFLSRPALANGVSEASLYIVGRSAMRVGTELLVMSPVWSQAPEGLWARLRAVTAEEGSFLHEFIFFGASDLVQREIRKFTRAEYVRKKAQGQS